jgi:hypothetical protein
MKPSKKNTTKSATKTKKPPYMQIVKADVRMQFKGRRERRLELTISIPVEVGRILVRRLGKRVNK